MDAGYEQRHRLWELAGICNYGDPRLVIGGQFSDPDDCIVTKNHNNYFVGSINGVCSAIPHEELFVLAKQTQYGKLNDGLQVFASVLGKEELQRLAKHELADVYYRAVKEICRRDEATSLKELSTILNVHEGTMQIILDDLVHCGDIEHTGDEMLRDGVINPLYCAIEGHHGTKAVEQMGYEINFYGVYKV